MLREAFNLKNLIILNQILLLVILWKNIEAIEQLNSNIKTLLTSSLIKHSTK